MKVITNNVPRFIVDAWELTPAERTEFDYLNWTAIEKGEDSASFFRYKGQVYDLAEFERVSSNLPDLQGWDGVQNETFFSGILVRYVNDESVIVGRYFT